MFDVADTVHVSVDVDITVFIQLVPVLHTGSVEVTLMREGTHNLQNTT